MIRAILGWYLLIGLVRFILIVTYTASRKYNTEFFKVWKSASIFWKADILLSNTALYPLYMAWFCWRDRRDIANLFRRIFDRLFRRRRSGTFSFTVAHKQGCPLASPKVIGICRCREPQEKDKP